jgi:hypothetical protein
MKPDHLQGGVAVSEVATGYKGRGFKPGRGGGFLRAIKICNTPSFGWEVKPEVPCKILRHVNELLKSHGDEYTKFSFHSPIFYCSRGVSGDGQSAVVVKLGVSPSRSRLLTGSYRYHRGILQKPKVAVLKRQSYPITISNLQSTMVLHAHISPAGWRIDPLVAAVLRHSLTPSQSVKQSISQSIKYLPAKLQYGCSISLMKYITYKLTEYTVLAILCKLPSSLSSKWWVSLHTHFS